VAAVAAVVLAVQVQAQVATTLAQPPYCVVSHTLLLLVLVVRLAYIPRAPLPTTQARPDRPAPRSILLRSAAAAAAVDLA